MNDSESQLLIGQTYLKGNKNVPQNLKLALKFFRMGAENGYAPAQRELAKLMDSLNDLGDEGKSAISEMNDQWQDETKTNQLPMTALSWMMLAAEKKENKWFYFAPATTDEEAVKLIEQMRSKYSSEEKNASLAATQWKQALLMKQAKALLTEHAYKQFENIIYPSKIEPPKMSREKAVEELKKLKMSKSK
jgi:TPR repeat protein